MEYISCHSCKLLLTTIWKENNKKGTFQRTHMETYLLNEKKIGEIF